MRQVRYTVFNAINGTSTVNSAAIDANQLFAASVQAFATGTITGGSAKLQFSNDYEPLSQPQSSNYQPTHWTDVPQAVIDVEASGPAGLPKTDLCYRWIRITYTGGTGSGLVTINLMAQSI